MVTCTLCLQVVSLLKGGAGGVGSDAELEEAYNNCGDHYAELNRWPEAMPYYEKVWYDTQSSDRIERMSIHRVGIWRSWWNVLTH